MKSWGPPLRWCHHQAGNLSFGVGEPFAPLPRPFLPLTLLPSQGLYQWVYHTHEDAQEARASQEAPGEDPSGEGSREEDQSDSGTRTGGQRVQRGLGPLSVYTLP